jgi:hypothetical protein
VEPGQIYVAPVVVNDQGVHTFPAIYLWNQPANRFNTTPIWDALAIPPVP